MVKITSIIRTETEQWRFTWEDTGADSYRIIYRGFEITTVTGIVYVYDLPWPSSINPPPLEIVEVGDLSPSEKDRPYIVLQWYRAIGADSYLIEQWTGAAWITKATVSDNGSWVNTWMSGAVADETTFKYRIRAVGDLDNFSDDIQFEYKVVRPPDPPAVEIDYDAGTEEITVEVA